MLARPPLYLQRRPTGPVPTDPDHEFLGVWLPHRDEDLESWIRWFKSCRVRYAITTDYRTQNGHSGAHYMIYTHRLLIPTRGGESRWCCEEEA